MINNADNDTDDIKNLFFRLENRYINKKRLFLQDFIIKKQIMLIASDHAGYDLKEFLKENYSQVSEWKDFGTHSADSVDYPDFAHPLAAEMEKNPTQQGVLICGTGNGIAMTANKHPNVRAAICWNVEIAKMARLHNDANILVLPARAISQEEAMAIITIFFETPFEGGRHQNRINKINL